MRAIQRRLVRLLVSVAVLASRPVAGQDAPAIAIRWQLAPFCNVLALEATPQGQQYHLRGTESTCADARSAAVNGTAFPNLDGTFGMGVTTVTPGGTAIHTTAAIEPTTLGGSWRDSVGNTGVLVVLPPNATSGGAVRPVPTVGIAPATLTAAEFAPGAIDETALAPGTIEAALQALGTFCQPYQYLRGFGFHVMICEAKPPVSDGGPSAPNRILLRRGVAETPPPPCRLSATCR